MKLNKIIYIIPLFTCFFIIAIGQAPAIQWQKCYGGGSSDQAFSIEQTSEGGYIVVGQITSSTGDVTVNHGGSDIWVVKINSTGNISWQKSLGGSGNETASAIKQTVDGGYIVEGTTSSNDGDVSGNHGGSDIWIIKLSSLGDIEWQRCYGGTGGETAASIDRTVDGGYIIAGYTNSNNGDVSGNHYSFTSDYWLIKITSIGNINWQKCYGGTKSEIAHSVKQTTDGGYIIAGASFSNDGDVSGNHLNGTTTTADFWIVKTDSNGNISWQRSLGGPDVDNAYSIAQNSDNGYIVGGTTLSASGDVSSTHGSWDFWVIRLDEMGSIVWEKTFGGSNLDECFSVQQTTDGGFVMAGGSRSNDGNVTGLLGQSDYWIVKVSGAGAIEWQKCYGGNGFESARCIQQTPDGGYIIAGAAGSNNTGAVGFNNGSDDYWIVKLAPDPLPVKSGKLDTKEQAGSVLCSWQTYEEQNSNRFVIERSIDGLDFKDIGMVKAAGNSQVTLNYNFTDNGAFETGSENLYYRLRMIDNDGSFSYSNISFVKLKFSSFISIHPNPATDQLKVSFTSLQNFNAVIKITDASGRLILENNKAVKKGTNTFTINISSLSIGNYILTVTGESNYAIKFIKIKE